MKFDFNSLKGRLLVYLVICMTITVAIIIVIVRFDIQRRAEETLAKARSAFDKLERQEIDKLAAVSEVVMQNEEIMEAFQERDRKRLSELTAPIFEKLSKNYQINYWFFMAADKTCILRVHDQDNYGDVISRDTLENAAKTRISSSGKELEEGKLVLRVVQPILEDGEIAGFIEMGSGISRFLNLLKEFSGGDFGLFIKRRFLPADMVSGNNEIILLEKTDKDLERVDFTGDIESVPMNGQALSPIRYAGYYFSSGVFPVTDFMGRRIGGLFVITDFTPVYKTLKFTIVVIIIIIVTIFSVAFYTLNRLIFLRLRNIIEVATRVVGGDFECRINPSSRDEIGQFEALFEQLRQLLVNTIQDLEGLAARAESAEGLATEEEVEEDGSDDGTTGDS